MRCQYKACSLRYATSTQVQFGDYSLETHLSLQYLSYLYYYFFLFLYFFLISDILRGYQHHSVISQDHFHRWLALILWNHVFLFWNHFAILIAVLVCKFLYRVGKLVYWILYFAEIFKIFGHQASLWEHQIQLIQRILSISNFCFFPLLFIPLQYIYINS